MQTPRFLHSSFIFIIYFISSTISANEQSSLTSEPDLQITMGGDKDYYPYTYLDSSGEATGLDVNIMQAIAEELNVEINFELGVWNDIINKLDNNEIDVVPMFINEKRSKIYNFSNTHKVRHYVLFGRADSRYIDSIDDINDKTILVQSNTMGENWLVEEGLGSSILSIDDGNNLLVEFNDGLGDYLLIEEPQGRNYIKKLKYENIHVKSPPLVYGDYAYAVKSNNKELLHLINLGLTRIYNSGKYEELLSDYEKDINPRSIFYYVIVIAITLLLLVSVITLYKYRAKIKYVSSQISDEIKKRLQAERQAIYLINHDADTGLLNHKKVSEELKSLIQKNPNRNIGVLHLSIRDFSIITRDAGFDFSNKLIIEFTNYLRRFDVIDIGSFSAGHIVLILMPKTGNEETIETAKHIFTQCQKYYMVSNVQLDIRCYAGLSLFPDHVNEPEILLRHAELANAIAEESRTDFQIYGPELEPDQRTVRLLSDFKQALVDDQFQLYYQPKHSLRHNKTTGAEVLCRWQHPELGFLPPGMFIPLLENTGLIKELTCHLMAKVMDKQHELKEFNIKLSLNVSTKDLTDPVFVQTAVDLSKYYDSALILEITETAFTNNYSLFIENSIQLKELGYALSIDDYGIGYSSMQYLRDIKPYELKIDQAFIKNLCSSHEDQILVSSTVKMAQEMKIKIVAEGVEDKHTAIKLKELGCHVVQGYGIAKPMDEKTFINWIKQPDFSLAS